MDTFNPCDLKSWILVKDNWLSAEECGAFVTLLNTSQNEKIDLEHRKCVKCDRIEHTPGLLNLLKEKVSQECADYQVLTQNKSLYFVKMLELPLIYKYLAQDTTLNYFSPHSDCWSMDSASRQLSIIIYLNDVEEGGETVFPALDLKVKPKKGRILMFPSSLQYIHEGLPPISDDKYIIVCWCHFQGQGHKYNVTPMPPKYV